MMVQFLVISKHVRNLFTNRKIIFSNSIFCTLLLGILFIVMLFACSNSDRLNKTQPWSIMMTESVVHRNPEPWMIDLREKPKWEYTQGLVLKAIMQVWEIYRKDRYFEYVLSYYQQFVKEDGSIWLYELEDYNIDRINPGKVLFTLYRETSNEKFKKAIFLLREQMKTHPRTNEGGFWHKKIYPYQMWLDGLYMAAPFLAEFAETFYEPELFDDVANQYIWMEKHVRDEESGLLFHGWDESKQQRWANPETGQSPHFWGRGMGWYAMALVDVLDYIPQGHPKRPAIIAILNRLVTALRKFQDSDTGLWYQVVDQGSRKGNYLESSASCMFVYTITKAVKKDYIDNDYILIAQKAYRGILKHFVEVDDKGLVNIHQACSVAGLGGNPYRDGSYEYYINEPKSSNDPKAVGPFILASLELETLEKNTQKNKVD